MDPRCQLDEAALAGAARAMADTLLHRGPDDAGTWTDPAAGVALGHRRLSILDLSALGHQPMVSAPGRYVIAFNGEIYNFGDLRGELAARGHTFRGHSDTEVLLAAFEEWGLHRALRRCDGMFALAVWDRRERRLHLARDRMGEKPLFYGWAGEVFLFGSELKALRAHPAWRGEVDRDALTLFLRFNYVPAPRSIFRGVFKLLPGTVLSLEPATRGELPQPVPYWSAREQATRGAAEPFAGSDDAAADHLEVLLRDAVGRQMVADVPLGAFLSGGVDSSTVVALMQAQSERPVRTFTIGFQEAGFNEAEHAREVARHLGTEHTELYVTPREAMEVIPSLPTMYDEPFADSSQIPTYLVSRLAREHVTVSLSGDGGDELFGGYNRYFHAPRIWSKIGWLPQGVRTVAARALTSVGPDAWDRAAGAAARWVRRGSPPARVGEKVRKLADVLAAGDPQAVYTTLVSSWAYPEEVVIGGNEPNTLLGAAGEWPRLGSFPERMMYLDALTYLPDDILAKVDRAAMAVSLETRVPMLDPHVVEFAWRLPLAMKVRGGTGKWLLRQVLYRHVPPRLIDRPKMGFGVPVGEWMRGPLRPWAEELLSQRRLREQGFFDPVPVQALWRDHLAGRRDGQFGLWGVLMFGAWLEEGAAEAAECAA